MRAVRERALAHSALEVLARRGRGLDRGTYDDLLRVAIDYTSPRPWWRFW